MEFVRMKTVHPAVVNSDGSAGRPGCEFQRRPAARINTRPFSLSAQEIVEERAGERRNPNPFGRTLSPLCGTREKTGKTPPESVNPMEMNGRGRRSIGKGSTTFILLLDYRQRSFRPDILVACF
jgi:hypothetical protein